MNPSNHLTPQLLRTDDGQELAVWETPGEDPPVVFAHATGLHGHCWDEVIRRLPGRHCLALDFRGHGRSSKPAPPYPWKVFGRDLVSLAERWKLNGAIAVGHSMGGHSIVLAAAQQPHIFGALLLVDPTIFPRAYYGKGPADSAFIARRRNTWSSPTEMYERFRYRMPFKAWQPQALRDYCDYALVPEGDAFVLACPPAIEAAIYAEANAPASDLYSRIPSIAQPVVIIRAGITAPPEAFNLSASPTASDLALWFPQACDVQLSGRSHFIPMETPELVAEEIRKLLLLE